MKVILIGNYEPAGQQSMLRFASLMERLLIQSGHEVQILQPYPLFGNLPPMAFGALGKKWLGYIDQFIIFPLTLLTRIKNADIMHICDHSSAMYLPWVKRRPHLITCHDLLAIRSACGHVPQNPTTFTGRILQDWIAQNLQRAQAVVCVSEQTQREFLSMVEGHAKVLRVVYNCLPYPYQPKKTVPSQDYLALLGLDNTSFFLHVGGNQWYKNRLGALQLFHALIQFPEYSQYHFVMVGKPLLNDLHDYIAINQLDERVHELVDITDEELSALYSRAEALLFPSLAEGFGWPPIEAQACGCPVVISDIAPLNEITARDAAIFIDPQDIPGSAEIIRAGLQKRELLVQAGLVNAARYSEETMLNKYLAIYDEIISSFEAGNKL
jgi:glycosyltransferase involved in cell wall biosynthesis